MYGEVQAKLTLKFGYACVVVIPHPYPMLSHKTEEFVD